MSPNEMEIPTTTTSFKPADQVVWTARCGSRVLGWLVIDSTVAGRSCGGLRLTPSVTERELRHLARSMTLKFGFLGLPQGGAKAGVIGDPETSPESRRHALSRFAAEIAPLHGKRQQSCQEWLGTVANLSNDWGFWHMGQFAADYRRHFGELPSETLRDRAS